MKLTCLALLMALLVSQMVEAYIFNNFRYDPSPLMAKRDSGSGGAMPTPQADNIQSWGKCSLRDH